jgi:hypothetical protein
MALRDHEGTVIDEFKGLWDQNDPEDTPLDHFQECENIKYIGSSSFGSRDGIDIHQTVAVPLKNVLRIYNFPTATENGLIVLVRNDDGDGEIYHIPSPGVAHGPLLTITGMTDFAFQPYAGRGYISPFTTFVVGDLNVEKGLENEFLYVYMGDGTAARKAAGSGPAGTLTATNGAAGHTDAGFHIFAFVFETTSGYLTPPSGFTTLTTTAAQAVDFSTIPVGDATFAKVHIVASKVVTDYNGDPTGYQLFFIPGASANNGTIVLPNISFFDADLLEDASHLLENYSEIPAGAALTLYHDRLCLATTFDDINIILVSFPGEPEAISQIDGLLVYPPDSNPITNIGEMRDVLYGFKRSKTAAWVDNDDVPSSWPYSGIDNALGTCVHGIATVLDSGAASVDFFFVATYQGICLFNGRYATPELTWKVYGLWQDLDRNEFRKIQMINNPVTKELLCVMPDNRLLSGNYANGLDPKNIRWAPWRYSFALNCIAIVNIDEVIVGADVS